MSFKEVSVEGELVQEPLAWRLRAIPQLQVLGLVVRLDSVLMMNILSPSERATQDAFHDHRVFMADRPTVQWSRSNVPVVVDPYLAGSSSGCRLSAMLVAPLPEILAVRGAGLDVTVGTLTGGHCAHCQDGLLRGAVRRSETRWLRVRVLSCRAAAIGYRGPSRPSQRYLRTKRGPVTESMSSYQRVFRKLGQTSYRQAMIGAMPITSRAFAKLSDSNKDQARGLVRYYYSLVEKERASRPAPVLNNRSSRFSSVSVLTHTVNILVTGFKTSRETSSPRCTSVTWSTSVTLIGAMGVAS